MKSVNWANSSACSVLTINALFSYDICHSVICWDYIWVKKNVLVNYRCFDWIAVFRVPHLSKESWSVLQLLCL